MYTQMGTSSEAMNPKTLNRSAIPFYTECSIADVESHDSFSTADIDVVDATPIIDIDTIPAPTPTESTLPAVVSSVITVDLTDLKDQIDNVLAHEHDESETISRLLEIEARLETEATSATIAANFARFKVGFLLEHIKKVKRGLLEKVKKAYAERHQRGHGKSTLNKCHNYYLIPGVDKYFRYSYEKVRCLYDMAKELFKGSSDPIGDILKEASLDIEEIDYLTPVKYLRATIGLERKAEKKGYTLSYSLAYAIVAADVGCNSSQALLEELDSYIMRYRTVNKAVEELVEAKNRRRETKPLGQTRPQATEPASGNDHVPPRPQATEPASGNDHVPLEKVSSTVIELTNWLKDEINDLGEDFSQELLDQFIKCHHEMTLLIDAAKKQLATKK